jgi:hypothetical protein
MTIINETRYTVGLQIAAYGDDSNLQTLERPLSLKQLSGEHAISTIEAHLPEEWSMTAGSFMLGRLKGSRSNVVSFPSLYNSSKRGINDTLGLSVVHPFIMLRETVARFCSDCSVPIRICVTALVDKRCATAAGELRGEIKKAAYPARMIPNTVVKYVIVSRSKLNKGTFIMA